MLLLEREEKNPVDWRETLDEWREILEVERKKILKCTIFGILTAQHLHSVIMYF